MGPEASSSLSPCSFNNAFNLPFDSELNNRGHGNQSLQICSVLLSIVFNSRSSNLSPRTRTTSLKGRNPLRSTSSCSEDTSQNTARIWAEKCSSSNCVLMFDASPCSDICSSSVASASSSVDGSVAFEWFVGARPAASVRQVCSRRSPKISPSGSRRMTTNFGLIFIAFARRSTSRGKITALRFTSASLITKLRTTAPVGGVTPAGTVRPSPGSKPEHGHSEATTIRHLNVTRNEGALLMSLLVLC
mmetsp:Transcript_19227/g.37154  ORF Transcript_19227/g.37154 Transcript_19227/m.37154 type:complete len:246 (+) Transcript_19227:334-1071(+)